MPFETWITFVAASSALLIIPGPTILTVISYSVAHGNRVSLPLVVAVALGDSTALFASILGLGAILATSAFWFSLIKVLGGVYLLYLGISLLRAKPPTSEFFIPKKSRTHWRAFANTYLVTAMNPKGIIFFVAFLPQFISPGVNAPYQLWLLASTFVFLATLSTMLYARFATAARNLLASQRSQKRFNLAGGLLLCSAGVWALLARRPA